MIYTASNLAALAAITKAVSEYSTGNDDNRDPYLVLAPVVMCGEVVGFINCELDETYDFIPCDKPYPASELRGRLGA